MSAHIEPIAPITLRTGQAWSPPKHARVTSEDGAVAAYPVAWDTSGLDLTTPGSYTLHGTITVPTYGDERGILVAERADPWVWREENEAGPTYYLTASYPTTMQVPSVGYDRIVLRRAASLNGLAQAQETVLLWAGNAEDTSSAPHAPVSDEFFRYFWAPELHRIGGDWYLLFTASTLSQDVWHIRPAMLRADGASDPMDPASWQEIGFVQAYPGGQDRPADREAFTHFSLDMTAFTVPDEQGDQSYVVWAEKPDASTLRIAPVEAGNPAQLTAPSVLLASPVYDWESNGPDVINEGPAVVLTDDRLLVYFSASSVDEHYAVGLVWASRDANLLDPASWTKESEPLLSTASFDGAQMGPGHISFAATEDGELPVVIYHARPPRSEWAPGADGGLNDPSRHARVALAQRDGEGVLRLGRTPSHLLPLDQRRVELRLTVN